MARPVENLVDQFKKLPGIGPKTAQRLVYFLLKAPKRETEFLVHALLAMKEQVVVCQECFNIAERSPCDICTDPHRQHDLICVAEEPLDVVAIERTGKFSGVYHVLGGCLSPIDGIGPEELRIDELLRRLDRSVIKEVILATNPNMEGEATAMYLQRLIHPRSVHMTRLAMGLPNGGDLEYADSVTLGRSIEGRKEV